MVPPLLESSVIWPNCSTCGSANAGVAARSPAAANAAVAAVVFDAMCENATSGSLRDVLAVLGLLNCSEV
jgi:hypothetical protein